MNEFTFIFRGRSAPASPEEQQKHTEKWMAWFKELSAAGHLKDIGHPLEFTGKLVSGTSKMVMDGPFAEAKDVIGGFSIIQAPDIETAVELSKGCPILLGGGAVEVRPIQRLNP